MRHTTTSVLRIEALEKRVAALEARLDEHGIFPDPPPIRGVPAARLQLRVVPLDEAIEEVED